jgi:hypothetical protein
VLHVSIANDEWLAILSANTCAIVAANMEFAALIRLIILLCRTDWDSRPRARANPHTHALDSLHPNAALVLTLRHCLEPLRPLCLFK